MNNKGFTLIELLISIVLLSLISTATTVVIINTIDKSREKSYSILIDNIKISAKNYFDECESKTITGNNKITCSRITSTTKTIDGFEYEIRTFESSFSLKSLVDYGLLKSSAKDSSGNKIIENPKTNENISDCEINVTKKIKKIDLSVEYIVNRNNASDEKCPIY